MTFSCTFYRATSMNIETKAKIDTSTERDAILKEEQPYE